MTDIVVDTDVATAALDRGRAEIGNTSDQAKSQEPQSSDPKVAELLRVLSEQTGGAADRAEEHTVVGAEAAEGLAAADAESASAAGAAPAAGTPNGGAGASSRVSSATLSPERIAAGQQSALTQQANQQSLQQQQQAQQVMAQQVAAQQQAAQQQMMFAAAQQAAAVAAPAAMTGGLPAGTIFVDPNDLASLIDSASSGSSSGSSTGSVWTGSTAPEPIDVNDVQYDKTHGTLSPSEVSAVIDSAMDKTGIEDPAAREKWKVVLTHMADSESSNNASAVNNWDSNAVGATQVDGSPAQSSRGMWQTIPTTFAAHHAAGTSANIYDPEASAGAAINYMKDRYNIGEDGSGLDEFYAARAPGNYVGY